MRPQPFLACLLYRPSLADFSCKPWKRANLRCGWPGRSRRP